MKKILIIEDQRTLCEEVCDWFVFEGFDAYSAENGKEGVMMAEKHLPDLILCDIMMPEMNGNEVLVKLRQNPATSLIPFIFMTALAERVQVRAGMEQGADDYITKPFTRIELLNAVTARLGKLEQMQEKSNETLNELRANLITSLPHELRTPLNGIIGFSQMLKDYPETFGPEELPELGERIYSSAMRLYRLIQNYLLYAQLELRKTGENPHYELKDPVEIIRRASEKMASACNRMDDLTIYSGAGTAFISELEFAKVVEELSDNAFKFSSPGQKVTISCLASQGRFFLTVEDHGRGISATDMEKIGAFMQFDRKIYEQQGFGLGLIISKRITELFDGTLTIESQPEKGTIIRVSLPGS
jgi:two-component system sensor histidine kinase/response regulator